MPCEYKHSDRHQKNKTALIVGSIVKGVVAIERSHDTIDPITTGNAAAAFPANSASSLPRLCQSFLSNL